MINIQNQLKELQNKIKDRQIFIGVVGVPGSGKTYFTQNILPLYVENFKVIMMDGYHIYRKDLSEQGILKRGAPFTFDKDKLKEDLLKLKAKQEGQFPSFEHHIKDPIENSIQITKDDRIIVVEGLYLYLKEWDLSNLFDLKIFIKKEFDIELIAQRHLNAGIEDSYENAYKRAKDNDEKNAQI
ncbi:hypothetical protein pb186bvf_011845 [Paramecium bursaria]